jgi:hypothetical protein
MHRMRGAAGAVAIVTLLAACAGVGTGAGSSASPAGTGAAPSGSAPASGEAATADHRVDIGTLGGDPASFQGQEVKVLARIDKILVDGVAFLTSPSASEEGQLAVIVRPDAQVDKDIQEGRTVWVEGTVVGFTADELESAGVDVSPDQLGDFQGEFVIVADRIGDPLASTDGS